MSCMYVMWLLEKGVPLSVDDKTFTSLLRAFTHGDGDDSIRLSLIILEINKDISQHFSEYIV